MILIIDHHDSFVENLARLVREVGAEKKVQTKILSQDEDLAAALAVKPRALILSPGPGTPANCGISSALVKHYKNKIPILGVCLGHLVLAAADTENIIGTAAKPHSLIGAANEPRHGKQTTINHNNHPLFAGINNPFCAGLYHSLAVKHCPPDFKIIATQNNDAEIMALAHKTLPLFGVQFHPESILTKDGANLIGNFLNYVRAQ